MITIQDLIEQGYEGTRDVDLETSLYEYGLIHKELDDGSCNFIVGVDVDENSIFNKFREQHLNKDAFLGEDDWYDVKEVLIMTGEDERKWSELSLIDRVERLLPYYGDENILGANAFYSFIDIEDADADITY